MAERVPKGYQITQNEWWGQMLQNDAKTEYFRLTDRTFSQIDHYLGYLPSQFIEYYSQKNPDGKTTVLDVAAGINHTAISEVAANFPHVRAIGVDLVANPDIPRDTSHIVQASAEYLPIADGSIDFFYSYQLFHYLHETQARNILKELSRVLKTGGVGIIDEHMDTRAVNEYLWKQGEEETILSSRQGNMSEPGRIIFGGPTRITLMKKGLVYDKSFHNVREKIIGHI